MWVVDGGDYRIEKFNSNGEYLSQFGSYGYGNGQFRGPNGIAIAPSGHIWVSDWYGRVEEFTAAGEFIQSISGGWPAAIAVDQVGNVWVANFGPENNVAKIDPKEGKYVSEFGSWGNGSGQFENLQAIDVMPSGNLVSGDRSGARVQEFTQSGEFVTGFGGWPEIGSPYGIAADTHGVIYVSSAYYNQVQKWCGPTIPEANTQAVSSVQSTEATLKGTVNPRCVATSYRFEDTAPRPNTAAKPPPNQKQSALAPMTSRSPRRSKASSPTRPTTTASLPKTPKAPPTAKTNPLPPHRPT